MMPDFPNFKARLWETLREWMRHKMIRKEPLLGAVSRFTIHEGKGGDLHRSDGLHSEFSLQASTSDIQLSREEMRRPNLEILLERISKMAGKIAGDEVAHIIGKIDEAVREAGNVTGNSGGIRGTHTLSPGLGAWLSLAEEATC